MLRFHSAISPKFLHISQQFYCFSFKLFNTFCYNHKIFIIFLPRFTFSQITAQFQYIFFKMFTLCTLPLIIGIISIAFYLLLFSRISFRNFSKLFPHFELLHFCSTAVGISCHALSELAKKKPKEKTLNYMSQQYLVRFLVHLIKVSLRGSSNWPNRIIDSSKM